MMNQNTGNSPFGGNETKQHGPAPAVGNYLVVISGEDWGPAVTKLIVDAGKQILPEQVSRTSLSVRVKAQHYDEITKTTSVVDAQRDVVDEYTSDSGGQRIFQPSRFITIQLPIHPADALSNPLFYDHLDEFNKWKTPYDFAVHSALLDSPATKCAGLLCPEAEAFALDTFESGTIKLSYAWYKPKSEGSRPLIIWLHGAGEGGTDPYVTLLGNKVTALASESIQERFGGAYVLVPQSPLVWMTQGGKPYDINKHAKASLFSEAVETLIRSFVASHPGIDPKRIYLGGCSNGGYMTMNLVLRNSGYFAAAFPVCEGYPDAWLSKDDIARLAAERLWFTASAKDEVLQPKDYMLPTVERIKEAGGRDIHMSYFDRIADSSGNYKNEDGTAFEYQGHWSWIPVLNNQCTEGSLSIMQWLAAH